MDISRQNWRRYDHSSDELNIKNAQSNEKRAPSATTSPLTEPRQPETHRFRSQIKPHYNKEGGDKLTNINKMSCYDLVIYTIDNPLLSVYDLYHNEVRCTQLKIKKDEDNNECERRNESSDHKEVR